MIIKTTVSINKSIFDKIKYSKEELLKEYKKQMFQNMTSKLYETFESEIKILPILNPTEERYECQLAILTRTQVNEISKIVKDFANLDISKNEFLSKFESILNETKIQ